MALEAEAKFKLTPEEAESLYLKSKILGSGNVQNRVEVNIYFDTPSKKLDKKGESFRIRSETPETGEASVKMTFKGKKKKSKFKVREELETTVESMDTACDIFKKLGLKETFRFEKRRTSFKEGKCLVEVDELPLIGFYCEVEGHPGDIEKTLKKLGFSTKKLISKGYAQLVFEAAKAKKISKKFVTF